MLRKGISTYSIAKFIQEEQGELTSMAPETIAARLRDWRQSMPAAAKIAAVRPEVVDKAMEELNQGMDESKEIQNLLAIQKARIKQLRDLEIAEDHISPQTGRELQLALDMIAQHAQIRVSLGLVNPEGVGGGGNIEKQLIETYGDAGERVQKVLENPSSRRKLLGLAEKLTGLANLGHGPDAKEAPAATKPALEAADEQEAREEAIP